MSGVPTICSSFRLSRTVERPSTLIAIDPMPNAMRTAAATRPPISNSLRMALLPSFVVDLFDRGVSVDAPDGNAIRSRTEGWCGFPRWSLAGFPQRGGRRPRRDGQLDWTCQSEEIDVAFQFGVAGPKPCERVVKRRGVAPTQRICPSLQRPGNRAQAGSGAASWTSSSGVTPARSGGPSGCAVPVRSTIRSCASWTRRVAFATPGLSRYLRRHSENFVEGVVFVKWFACEPSATYATGCVRVRFVTPDQARTVPEQCWL